MRHLAFNSRQDAFKMDCNSKICGGGDYISSNFLCKLANYVVQNDTRKERKIARHEDHRKENNQIITYEAVKKM